MMVATNEEDDIGKKYTCAVCTRKFHHRYSYRSHLCSHLKLPDGHYKCNRCGYSCETRRAMILHYLTHLRSEEKPFKCSLCSYASKYSTNLRSHKFHRHGDSGKLQCNFCEFTTGYKSNLIRHMMLIHGLQTDNSNHQTSKGKQVHVVVSMDEASRMITTSTQTDDNRIKYCDAETQTDSQDCVELKSNNTPQSHRDHIITADVSSDSLMDSLQLSPAHTKAILHETDPLLSDNVFSFLSEFVEDVSQNVTIPLVDARIDVPKTSKVVTTFDQPNEPHEVYGLVNTIMLKTPRRYRCKICSMYFTGRSELDWHKKSHVSNDIHDGFRCFECNFKSTRWESIKEHISMVHADLRPLRCDRCSFATRLRRDLIRHARTHNSDRPFLCPECGKKFVRQCHLNNHLVKLHKIEK